MMFALCLLCCVTDCCARDRLRCSDQVCGQGLDTSCEYAGLLSADDGGAIGRTRQSASAVQESVRAVLSTRRRRRSSRGAPSRRRRASEQRITRRLLSNAHVDAVVISGEAGGTGSSQTEESQSGVPRNRLVEPAESAGETAELAEPGSDDSDGEGSAAERCDAAGEPSTEIERAWSGCMVRRAC